jgi:hypothetical protein
MGKENPQSELTRLRNEQNKTRRDEVFGGLSPGERTAYDIKMERIHALEGELQASAVAEEKSQSGKAEKRRQWNKKSEPDTHQDEAHQPYRSREKDSASHSADSRRKRGKEKNEPEGKGS